MSILTDPVHLKNLMKSLGLKPKDYLGQNFLIDEQVLSDIVDIAKIKNNETIIEIGPGLGVLTGELVKKALKVIAIEKDRNLYSFLQNTISNEVRDLGLKDETSRSARSGNLVLINQDVLKFNFEEVKGDYKIVANIPYYLTSHLIQILLTLKHKPTRIVFMIQKEVGERIVAGAGELSILGISVQVFADASIEATVSKQSFWPMPKVDSVIISITPKNKFEISDQKLFFRILKIAFAGKRKQLHNTLVNGLKLSKEEIRKLLNDSGIDPTARPQDVEIRKWVELTKRAAGSVERGGGYEN
jgi:16S rRNA (adenine1518-N6/adenine1519-N6)-dimethyltransferase